MEKTHLRLNQLLPLNMPISILIDPSNRCNFKCTFCPTGNKELLKSVGREETMMSIDIFDKIVLDLSNWSESTGSIPKQIGFYKDGEPLLNKNLFYFISKIKNNRLAGRTYLTTNGALLTKEKCIQLANSGLTEVRISVEHVNDKGYQNITKTKVPYSQIKDNVNQLFDIKQNLNSDLHVHVKVVADILTENEKNQFIQDFTPIADSVALDKIMGWSDSESQDFSIGNIDHSSKRSRNQVCSQPFSRMTICANGDITVCCVDWKHQLKYGNVQETSLMNAWNSKELNLQRLQHLESNFNSDSVCKNCDYFKNQSEEDCIDSIKDELLTYYKSRS